MIVGLLLNYRDAERTARCVRSLLGEGLRHVVVWDNSADEGVSAGAVQEAFRGDAKLDLISSESNLGFAAGVNRGLEYCTATYPEAWVLLINNDARLLPGAVQKLVDALHASPQAPIASPDINHAGHVLGLGHYHRWTGMLSWRPRHGCFPYASGCCLLIATDRMRLPLFDEIFFMYGEDWELGWRLKQQDLQFAHVNETLVEHEGSASSGLGSLFYESSLVAAHLVLVRKLARGPVEACGLILVRIPTLIARAIVRSIRFRSLVPWKGLIRGSQAAFARGKRDI